MGPIQSITTCLRKALDFSGKASLSEFWWFYGFFMLGSFLTFTLRDIEIPYLSAWATDPAASAPTLLFTAVFLLPLMSVGARRFRDTGAPPFFFPLLVLIIISIEWQGNGPNFGSALATAALFFQCVRLSSSAPLPIWEQPTRG